MRGNSKKIQEASRNKTTPPPLPSITIPVRGYYDTLSTERKNNPVEEARKNTPYMTPQQLPCIIYIQSPWSSFKIFKKNTNTIIFMHKIYILSNIKR